MLLSINSIVRIAALFQSLKIFTALDAVISWRLGGMLWRIPVKYGRYFIFVAFIFLCLRIETFLNMIR